MAFAVNHLRGQDQVADLQLGLQGASKTTRDYDLRLIWNVAQNGLGQKPVQGFFHALLADSGFQDQHRQPLRAAESRSTGSAGKSLLGSKFLQKGSRFSP